MWNKKQYIPHFRSVVSCVNTLSEVFSKFLDWKLKDIVLHSFSYIIKNSNNIQTKLSASFPTSLPLTACLFSLDAVSIYSNINTQHALYKLRYFLNNYQRKKDPKLPLLFIMRILHKIMMDNIINSEIRSGDRYVEQPWELVLLLTTVTHTLEYTK